VERVKDFYSVLGVSASASADEMKKQYRKLAKKNHPDANASDPKAADRFKEISEAYTVLGDADKRKQYDEMRRLGAFGGYPGAGAGAARGHPGGRAGAPGSGPRGPGGTSFGFGADGGNVRFENFDVGGLGGLGDLFSSMFGNGARSAGGARSREPERGETVETTLEVPFRTAALGGKVPIELEVNEPCPTCHGSGGAPGASFSTCPECGGRGIVSIGQGGFAVNRPCPVCLGRGQVPSERCPTCHGVGEVRNRRKVLIAVPAGSDTGSRVRLRGQGGKGSGNAPSGDLVITLQVASDRFFRREGFDVIAAVPLNIAQATLGSKISVRTLDGRKVALKIPPGTPSGKRFRVRTQGIEKDGQRGDLIVEVTIDVPASLTEEQERMMREFAAAGGLKY
jgi:molecular chaperone DnaJ